MLSLHHNSPFHQMTNYLIQMGVMARQVDKNHFPYLNVTGEPKRNSNEWKIKKYRLDKEYNGNFTIAPYEPEFIEVK